MSEVIDHGSPARPAFLVNPRALLGRFIPTVLREKLRNPALLGTLATQFGSFGLFAVQGVLLARLLGPELRGVYGTAIFYVQMLLFAGMLGTMSAIARRAAHDRSGLDDLRRAAARTGLITSLGTWLAVGLLAAACLPPEKRYLAGLCFACGVILPIEQVRYALLAVDHGAEQFGRYNTNRLLSAAVYPLLLAAAFLLNLGSLPVVVAMFCAAPLVGLAALRLALGGWSAIGPARPHPARLVREGAPFSAAQVSSGLLEQLDVWLMLWLASFAVQGQYAVALPIARMMHVAPAGLALLAFNAGSKRGKRISRREMLIFAGGLMALQAVAAVSFMAILRPLMWLLFGEQFMAAVPFAYALIPAYAIGGAAMVADNFLLGRNRAFVGVRARLAGMAALLAGAWFLFPRLGPIGIPLAAVLAYVVVGIALLAALVQEVREPSAGPAGLAS